LGNAFASRNADRLHKFVLHFLHHSINAGLVVGLEGNYLNGRVHTAKYNKNAFRIENIKHERRLISFPRTVSRAST
jgi:hypothetical protein